MFALRIIHSKIKHCIFESTVQHMTIVNPQHCADWSMQYLLNISTNQHAALYCFPDARLTRLPLQLGYNIVSILSNSFTNQLMGKRVSKTRVYNVDHMF